MCVCAYVQMTNSGSLIKVDSDRLGVITGELMMVHTLSFLFLSSSVYPYVCIFHLHLRYFLHYFLPRLSIPCALLPHTLFLLLFYSHMRKITSCCGCWVKVGMVRCMRQSQRRQTQRANSNTWQSKFCPSPNWCK